MTTILGSNAFHGDYSTCLVRDGELLGAVEEERFRRIKHLAGLASEAIRGEASFSWDRKVLSNIQLYEWVMGWSPVAPSFVYV